MKLCGKEIPVLHGRTERQYVIARGDGLAADFGIVAVYEIYRIFAAKAVEQQRSRLLQVVPSDMWNDVGCRKSLY
jgi:hypothetical protein